MIAPKDIALINPAYWANMSKIKLANGRFTFVGREYLIEPMSSTFRRKTWIKGTQGGASLAVMLSDLHGMIYGRYPTGVLYLMPTADDVQEFSKSKFNPLITDNPTAIGKYVKSAGATDTASLKKVGQTAHLYLRSGGLSKTIDIGYKESSKLKSITVDKVSFDEVDVMDEEIIQKAIGRMGASEVKAEDYIGNPGVPNRGIDAFFRESDQRHWWMTCKKCGTETCAEHEFFDNPGFIKVNDDGSSYLGCKRCGNPIGNQGGNWKPDVPANSMKMHGYRWSQLIIPFSNPYQILQDYRYPPQDNLGDVMRTKLGMPFISTEDVITKSQVFACCGDYPMLDYHKGPCAMGVDVGDVKHIVIGGRTANDKFEIFKACRLRDWNDIHDLAKRFNVRSAVVDLRPFADKAREFQKREKYRVFLCEYTESSPLGVQYNSKTGLVKVQRTEIFDQTGKMFSQGDVTIPRKSPEMVEFARQVTDPICVEEKDKRKGTLVRRYRGKNDHYRNAMNYFRLAADGGKVARVKREGTRNRPTRAMNDYARI